LRREAIPRGRQAGSGGRRWGRGRVDPDADPLAATTQIERAVGESRDVEAGCCGGGLADQDVTRTSLGTKAGRDVHRVPKCREVERVAVSHVPDERDACVDPDANWEPRLAVICPSGLHQPACRRDRARGVIGSGEAGDEERDGFVPHELVDDAVMIVDDPGATP
jgi:hypothetical protein